MALFGKTTRNNPCGRGLLPALALLPSPKCCQVSPRSNHMFVQPGCTKPAVETRKRASAKICRSEDGRMPVQVAESSTPSFSFCSLNVKLLFCLAEPQLQQFRVLVTLPPKRRSFNSPFDDQESAADIWTLPFRKQVHRWSAGFHKFERYSGLPDPRPAEASS